MLIQSWWICGSLIGVDGFEEKPGYLWQDFIYIAFYYYVEYVWKLATCLSLVVNNIFKVNKVSLIFRNKDRTTNKQQKLCNNITLQLPSMPTDLFTLKMFLANNTLISGYRTRCYSTTLCIWIEPAAWDRRPSERRYRMTSWAPPFIWHHCILVCRQNKV